ncbi:YbhB/YbcL family Raf kinase inhibitor-like protein [Glaciimonas sp. PCH181]|uniref:YbhB/YbcL family Raf kinase inhibitor-like protein n=1 Tax=Glaciimonas sp. PCH181 TaxID=2133943 RepID=UPI000D35DE7D|nr:YbhB/YbcL family Raf kinase inhibitor-like protein [Glaciimonas sp. PCH181]PUA16408.1 YbhB/YbcL family Raf kinase inhibitor-like protein [Glaciimonas sp. PCH181]
MKFWSESFKDWAVIPGEFAFGVIDPITHVALSTNHNPHFGWSDLPAGTQSLALICHDPDVPSRGDDVNQEGKTVSANLPRVDFFHWVLVDLPPHDGAITAATFSAGVTPRGKSGPAISNSPIAGARHGLNDYTGWFAADPDMSGDYFGFDGPCPPWNDAILHHYVFTLYALDVARLPIDGKFNGQQALAVLQDHIVGQAAITGTYTLNPVLFQP